MPKRTRAMDARELLYVIEHGPAFVNDSQNLKRRYNLWAKTWILPKIKELIPELRGMK